MKFKLVHPLWTHLPAAAVLIALVAYSFTAGPLPSEAPVHFGFSGAADRYGSPWEILGLVIGISVLFILMSVLFDELWARQEKAKSFNWLSLFDDFFVGLMAGTSFGYISFIQSGTGSFEFPWGYLLLFSGGATALAVLLDIVRPYRPYSAATVVAESPGLAEEVARRLKEDSAFVYWDSQNPLYVSLITIVLPLVMFVSAIITWFGVPWASIVLALVGVMLIIPYGGQRTVVTRHQIVIRWGLGLRVLRLDTADITGAEIHEFEPLKDFGGYGIRFNREMRAYYLRGNRGVKITRTSGKPVLIGSDRPEALCTVIRGITGSG
jgi:hypothetical protein